MSRHLGIFTQAFALISPANSALNAQAYIDEPEAQSDVETLSGRLTNTLDARSASLQQSLLIE